MHLIDWAYWGDKKKLWLLIAAATLVRVLFAQVGLGIDETYTVATSRTFSLSVFDHPPVAWWLTGLMQRLFHTSAPFVLRLPFIVLSGIAMWQINRLTCFLFSNKAGLFAVLAFACAPALGITSGTWVLPDGPLIVGLLAAAICVAHCAFDDEPKGWLWLAAGFWGGVALLSKYHGIFLFGGIGLFILGTKNMRHWLASPWPYLGVIIGLAVFSPALIWNYEHHWVSFAFQGGRVGKSQFHPLKPLFTLMGQALYLLPWLWIALCVATLSALRTMGTHNKNWFLLCLGVPQIVLFTLAAFTASTPMLYHWAMPGYLFLLPLLGDGLARQQSAHPALVRRMAIASAVTTFGLVLGISFLWFAPTMTRAIGFTHDPLIDMRSVSEINAYLDSNFAGRTDIVVAPTKWHLAGKFDYALNGRLPVTCLCVDARQYGIIAPASAMIGKDFLIPVAAKDVESVAANIAPLFGQIKRLDNLVIHAGTIPVEEFALFYGTDLRSAPKL